MNVNLEALHGHSLRLYLSKGWRIRIAAFDIDCRRRRDIQFLIGSPIFRPSIAKLPLVANQRKGEIKEAKHKHRQQYRLSYEYTYSADGCLAEL